MRISETIETGRVQDPNYETTLTPSENALIGKIRRDLQPMATDSACGPG